MTFIGGALPLRARRTASRVRIFAQIKPAVQNPGGGIMNSTLLREKSQKFEINGGDAVAEPFPLNLLRKKGNRTKPCITYYYSAMFMIQRPEEHQESHKI